MKNKKQLKSLLREILEEENLLPARTSGYEEIQTPELSQQPQLLPTPSSEISESRTVIIRRTQIEIITTKKY